MISELGHFALILAFMMALSQSVLPLIGAHKGNAAWMALARPSARGQFLFVAIAYGCLTYAFVTDDFSVQLAAQHSNSMLPLVYMCWINKQNKPKILGLKKASLIRFIQHK